MPDKSPSSLNNVDRLLKHLTDESLAARLVQAHRAPGPGGSIESMKTVLTGLLNQVREKLDAGED